MIRIYFTKDFIVGELMADLKTALPALHLYPFAGTSEDSRHYIDVEEGTDQATQDTIAQVITDYTKVAVDEVTYYNEQQVKKLDVMLEDSTEFQAVKTDVDAMK